MNCYLYKFRTVIFIHGCFWHGHSCNRGKLPETNHEFWREKISKNMGRDSRDIFELKRKGWKVIIVWQCEISNKKNRDSRLNNLIEEINNYF